MHFLPEGLEHWTILPETKGRAVHGRKTVILLMSKEFSLRWLNSSSVFTVDSCEAAEFAHKDARLPGFRLQKSVHENEMFSTETWETWLSENYGIQ